MVYRKLLLSIVLSLLASCARAPVVVDSVPTTPDVPSALSTDLDDIADDVATDAQGNAYVVGYRNQDVKDDVNSGGAFYPAELFVAKFGLTGTLEWLTVLRTNQLDTLRYQFSIEVTDTAVYALTLSNQDTDPQPLYLHKLNFDGTLLWSKVISERTSYVYDGLYTSNTGNLYVNYSEIIDDNGNFVSNVRVVNDRGFVNSLRPGRLVGVATDGSLYYVDGLDLLKYGGNGTLIWSQDISPSIPYIDDPNSYAFVFTSFLTGEKAIYALLEFYPTSGRGDTLTTEIVRYTSDGTKVWSRFLHPIRAEGSGIAYSTFPVGVTSDESLLLLVESRQSSADGCCFTSTQQLHNFSITGEHASISTEVPSGGVEAASLVPAQVSSPAGFVQTAFYTVSSSGKWLRACGGDITVPAPCIHSDAFTNLYTFSNDLNQPLRARLEWSRR